MRIVVADAHEHTSAWIQRICSSRRSASARGRWAAEDGHSRWGPQDDADSVAAIRAALDRGINWIDTAAVYGLGHSEEVVARALKGGATPVSSSPSAARVWDERPPDRQVAKARLHPRASAKPASAGSGSTSSICTRSTGPSRTKRSKRAGQRWRKLRRRQSALRRRVELQPTQLERAQAIRPITSLQPPYSMLRRDIEAEIVPWCAAHDVGILAYSPMQAGLLTGTFTAARAAALGTDDWRSRHPAFQDPQLSINLRLVDSLRPIAAQLGVSVAQLVLAWVLRLPEVTSAIAGARSADRDSGDRPRRRRAARQSGRRRDRGVVAAAGAGGCGRRNLTMASVRSCTPDSASP